MTHGNLPLAEFAAFYAQSVVRARTQLNTRPDLTRRESLRRVCGAENLVIDCARIMMARIARVPNDTTAFC